jgi:hypothetical protein
MDGGAARWRLAGAIADLLWDYALRHSDELDSPPRTGGDNADVPASES